jgi:hypothetical protein
MLGASKNFKGLAELVKDNHEVMVMPIDLRKP